MPCLASLAVDFVIVDAVIGRPIASSIETKSRDAPELSTLEDRRTPASSVSYSLAQKVPCERKRIRRRGMNMALSPYPR